MPPLTGLTLVLLIIGLCEWVVCPFPPLAPFITTVPGVARQKDKSPGAYVWYLSAVDVNPGDTFTFSLSGPGSEKFEVTQKKDSRNQLKNYLTVKELLADNTVYNIRVTATDNTGLSSSEIMTVRTGKYA